MRWLICLLLALLVIWQILPSGDKSEDIREVAKSSRRVLDAKWRALPEREMTIADMERYAAGLSDGELWGELEKSCEIWLKENDGRKRFTQPRFVIMVAREIGKREGESGMKAVTQWIDGLPPIGDFIENPKVVMRSRVYLATLGGWISAAPEVAVSQLIAAENELRLVEGHWAFRFLNGPCGFANTELMRRGFREITRQDPERAIELLRKGTCENVFDFNEVVEAVYGELSEEGRVQLLSQASNWFESEEDRDTMIKKLERTEIFEGDAERYFKARDGSGELWRDFIILGRMRRKEAFKLMQQERLSNDSQRWLAISLSIQSPEFYPLLELHGPSISVGQFLWVSEDYHAGPLTGRENAANLDLESLREAVRAMDMSDGERAAVERILRD